jgi:hypothetical protein
MNLYEIFRGILAKQIVGTPSGITINYITLNLINLIVSTLL